MAKTRKLIPLGVLSITFTVEDNVKSEEDAR